MRHPYHLSDEELKEYANSHLQYELNMLTESVRILMFLGTKKNDRHLHWALNNGLLNTFSIHARNLISFLYPEESKNNYASDIQINDYADKNDISLYLTPITQLLIDASKKANKQVAHLTFDRIEYEKNSSLKKWEFTKVTSQIRIALASVVPYIPNEKISNELRDKLSQTFIEIPGIDIKTIHSENGKDIGISLSLADDNKITI